MYYISKTTWYYVRYDYDQCHNMLIYVALKEVGIFRLPGQASRVQDLKDLYDQGKQCIVIRLI